MNVFVIELEKSHLDDIEQNHSNRIKIEDNIGESIHIHYRNIRQEFSINEFRDLADGLNKALEDVENGD